MLGVWFMVLPLLVDLNMVKMQPVTKISDEPRHFDTGDCCPCPQSSTTSSYSGLRLSDLDGFADSSIMTGIGYCPCQSHSDAETSPSMLLPSLRAVQHFAKQTNQQNEPKPLLQPEVGLASSVLETLQKATDEEYQDALARDAARSAVKLIESDLSLLDDVQTERPKNVVSIFVNPTNDVEHRDAMDDNLPEPSHIQETRCIHPSLESINTAQLRMSHPPPLSEVFNSQLRSTKKINTKGLLHKSLYDMDSNIGASNIQERVLKPTNIGDDISLDDVISPDLSTAKSQTLKPGFNLKVKDLADKLEITSIKDKLHEYFATSTKLPPFKLKPLDKSILRNHKPSLKDLLKLKDVEIIPQQPFAKKALMSETSYNPNNVSVILEKPLNFDYISNDKYINSENNEPNFAPSINEDVIKNIAAVSSEMDTVKNLNNDNLEINKPSDKGHNNINLHKDTNDCDTRLIMNSANSNIDTSSELIDDINFYDDDTRNENQHDDDDTSTKSDSNGEASVQQFKSHILPNQERIDQEVNENPQDINNDEDMSNEESINNLYQIELLEDLNIPVEFDNSTFDSDKNDADKISSANKNEINEIGNDSNKKNGINDSQSIEQTEESPNMSELLMHNSANNCKDKFAEISNPILDIDNDDIYTEERKTGNDIVSMKSEAINSMENSKEIFSVKHNDSRNTFPESDKYLSHYHDLQEMSDSILSLSECMPFKVETIKTTSDIDKTTDENLETPNTSTISSQCKETEDKDELTIDDNDMIDELSSQNSIESVCKSLMNANDKSVAESDKIVSNLVQGNSEMVAEASIPDSTSLNFSKLDQSKDSFPTTIDSTSSPKTLRLSKHSKILDNLKLKLANIFTTTEKITEMDLSNSDDNINESSNVNPIVTLFDDSKSLGKFNIKPQNFIKQNALVLPSKNSGLTLNSFKNRLAVPKTLDKTINLDPSINSRIGLLAPSIARNAIRQENLQDTFVNKPQILRTPLDNSLDRDNIGSTFINNARNLLNSPLEFTRPFEDTIKSTSSLANFSNRLRSHTESALQNVKENLESKLEESEKLGVIISPNTFDTQDILELISSRRNEMNEKLQAIHSDINDRFSAFQQSLLDQLSVPAAKNSEFFVDSSETSLPIAPNWITTNKQDSKSFLLPELSILKNKQSTENVFKSPVLSKVLDKSQFQNNNKAKPNLEQNVGKHKQGLILDTSKSPNIKMKLTMDKYSDVKTPVSISTRTRPQTSKTKLDSKQKMNADTSETNVRQSKIPILSEKALTGNKQSSINYGKNIKANKEEQTSFGKDSPTESLVNKLRENLLKINQDVKPKSHIKLPLGHKPLLMNLMSGEDDSSNKNVFSRRREESIRDSQKALTRNNNRNLNPLTVTDTTHSATQNLDEIREVEPLKENIPYKCKLICYKDI